MSRLRGVDSQGGHGQVRLVVLVKFDQRVVVHLVDVVASQNDHVLGPFLFQRVDVLVNGIGGTLVPVFVNALLWRHHVDEFTQFAAEEMTPTDVDMPVQAHGLVLREDQHFAQAAIQAIGQGEIDDAVGASERHRRLGSISGQGFQPRPLATCQNDGQDINHVASPGSGCLAPCSSLAGQ